MLAAPIPANEAERLAALHSLRILDTSREEAYDRLIAYAARTCEVPIALVSLVDANRQWFKSRIGIDACETARDISFCGHTILQSDVFIIEDASRDERFFDNPLVTGAPHIRFYAGAPIVNEDGLALGTVCIIDSQPRSLTPLQIDALRHVADHVGLLMEMHRARQHIADYHAALEAYREKAEEERQLVGYLMTRMMSPQQLDASAIDYWMRPTESLGGDLIAASRSPHGKYYVLVADSTGHGLPAAVNLLPISRIFYHLVEKNLPLSLIVEEMNRSIREQSPVGRFVAALLLCFDAFNRSVEVWNGAIPVAVYLDLDGRPLRRFPPANLPLGLDDGEQPPRTELFQWQQEGQFFACTDGLLEAPFDGHVTGEEALDALLASVPPAGRLQGVQGRMEAVFLETPPHDDVSAMLVDVRKL